MPPSATDAPPVRERIRKSADYARTQKEGRRHRSAHLLLLAARGCAPGTRVGLTVSRKVGTAVTRNRVKRWLREAVRTVPGPQGGPWDLVLIPRSEAADVGLEGLRGEVADLFARVSR